MTAKEYLSQARLLDARINAKIQQVAALNDLATHATATLTGMPRNPNRSESRMAEAVVKIVDLQNEINHDIDELVDLKREITRRVKSIPNAEYQLLLEKRYLCFMPWEKIAVDMGYSIQHIYRLHDWALREFPVPRKHESSMYRMRVPPRGTIIIAKRIKRSHRGATPAVAFLMPGRRWNGAHKAKAPLFVPRLSQADGRQVLRGARQGGS